MSSIPIKSPASYAVSQAIAYADTDGTALLVSASAPLPVNLGSTAVPVNGSVSLAGALPAFAATPTVNIGTLPEVEIRNDAGNPLPVAGTVAISNATLAVNVTNSAALAVSVNPPTTTALAGSASASGVIGPFTPVLGRAAVLMLAGSWAGTVKVSRSTDAGATRQPLTVAGSPWAQFTGNACEAVWEESDPTARLYLEITLTSGTVNYRLSQ
jgi:hypothetical protein